MSEKLIEIKQDMPGFNRFISSWICRDVINIIIDVGPANSAQRLIDSLTAIGLERVDYILITHIHIDHAGGLADLMDHYPMARVICHKDSIKFLVDPARLWKGSLKVLGKIARLFGPPKPVPRERLTPHTKNEIKDLLIIETPGHAAHHLSFSYRSHLFAGEAGGTYLALKNAEYMRPATPPRFFFDVCLNSIDRLLALENQPIFYAHFGKAESSHLMLKKFRCQLSLWKEIIYKFAAGSLRGDELIEKCLRTLLEKDPSLKAFHQLDIDIRERERFFMRNSINGYLGSFEESLKNQN